MDGGTHGSLHRDIGTLLRDSTPRCSPRQIIACIYARCLPCGFLGGLFILAFHLLPCPQHFTVQYAPVLTAAPKHMIFNLSLPLTPLCTHTHTCTHTRAHTRARARPPLLQGDPARLEAGEHSPRRVPQREDQRLRAKPGPHAYHGDLLWHARLRRPRGDQAGVVLGEGRRKWATRRVNG